MKKNLMFRVMAVALMFIACGQMRAAVTIHVNASSAPHVYAWDNSKTDLLGAWPGKQLTKVKKVGDKDWYYIDVDDSNGVNIIISNGSDATKTGDITDITGDRYFEFTSGSANNVTDYYDYPTGVKYETRPFTYLVNVKRWSKVYAYVWDKNSNQNAEYPGVEMTLVGRNANGFDVYEWTGDTPANPTNVIFTNGSEGSDNKSGDLTWKNGAYWSNHEYDSRLTVEGVVLNSTYFPDENLRKAIGAATGVEEGNPITTRDVTVLDISYDESKGMTGKVTDPAGLNYFDHLEELYSKNNSLSHLDLRNSPVLRVLDISGDNTLLGFRASTYISASGHGIAVKEGITTFKSFTADGCTQLCYMAGLNSTNQKISSLERISLKNCEKMDGWSSGIAQQKGLKYLDLTNTGQDAGHSTNDSRISLSALTALDTLILANNKNLANVPDIKNCTQLKYLDLSNCAISRDALNKENFEGAGGANLKYLDVSGNTLLYSLYVMDKTGLETLLMSGCKAYDWGSLEYCPQLKHVDLSGCTAMVTTMWSHLKGDVHTALQYLNLGNGTTAVSGQEINFPALDTLVINNHSTITHLNVTGHCPAVIDIANDPKLTKLSITACGLTEFTAQLVGTETSAALTTLDLTGNLFTAVPDVSAGAFTTMVMNNNRLTSLSAPQGVKYLYAQNNDFGGADYTLPATSLVGLDLGNNGFTRFAATGNTSLKALSLAGNTALTEIELHGNTALTQTSPDGVIESENGLYIKGLSNLQTLNIENGAFEKLGQNNSLEGLTALTKLQARNNKLTTFTNGVNDLHTAGSSVNYRKADPTQSSLEHLTALEYLDLAYNELCDSVHLYRNTALKHLDVSHNNHITGVIDGTITTEAQKQAMIEKKGRRMMKYGKTGNKTYGVNATAAQWTSHYTNMQARRERPFDLRECDLNDTTGLYHLDLSKNVNLEWLDISYTNIHNTAAGPTYMCPGWMNKDWATDDDLSATIATTKNTSGRWYTSWHTFVYFIPCSKLKTFHADHNNMCSLGVKYFPELDTLTCSYMYGDCAFMRDFNGSGDLLYGNGNIGLSASVQKLKSMTWGTDDSNSPTAVPVLQGPDGTTSTSYPNPTKYYDLSHSGFNEIRLTPGINLEYADVSGNPLSYALHAAYNSLDVTYSPNIKTLLATDCEALPTVRAHNREMLTTLDLTGSTALATVYAQNDPALPQVTGLSTLAALKTLFVYNNTLFGGVDVSNNAALENLWMSNTGATTLDLSGNASLLKLRAYDNALQALDVSPCSKLQWLDVARNGIAALDLQANAALNYFNCSNSEETPAEIGSQVTDNHDGSDYDGDRSLSNTDSRASGGNNSLSDLVFNATAPIAEVRANFNDLHRIEGGFGSLSHMEYAHNHINGIDLSAAAGNEPTIIDNDNGRTITAECSKFKIRINNNVEDVTLYFFQLENNVEKGGAVITSKTSTDSKNNVRYLGEDGFVTAKLNEWTGDAALYVPAQGSPMLKATTVTPDNMTSILGEVRGTVVVLKPELETASGAEGRAVYEYNNGVGASEFYLDWSSSGTVTGIDEVAAVGTPSVTVGQGTLEVTGDDGTRVTVCDMNGRIVLDAPIEGGKATVTGLAPGIYIVNDAKVIVR